MRYTPTQGEAGEDATCSYVFHCWRWMVETELSRIDFSKGGGLVPVIVQDARTCAILMLGYVNREAMDRTLATGHLHLWSRSRQEIWLKGEKSGNFLLVRRMTLDCDGDALLAEVEAATGETPVCHTGADTCFFTDIPMTAEDQNCPAVPKKISASSNTCP